jgi:hypothetical protein
MHNSDWSKKGHCTFLNDHAEFRLTVARLEGKDGEAALFLSVGEGR